MTEPTNSLRGSNEQKLATVVFDLDGTLTDPKLGITECVRHGLKCVGIEPPPNDELEWVIGPPLRQSLARLIPGSDPCEVESCLSQYRARFAEVGLYENELYGHIVSVIEQLNSAGFRLFVATSKPHVYATRILDHFGISGHFAGLFGSELDGTMSDKSDLLRSLVAETKTDPSTAVMIGDRDVDFMAARSVGMRSIAVAYGYGTVEELALADAIVESANELPATVMALLSQSI